MSSDGANLDVGAGALGEGGGDEWEEGVDSWATERGRVGAEQRRGESGLCDGQLRSRHGEERKSWIRT